MKKIIVLLTGVALVSSIYGCNENKLESNLASENIVVEEKESVEIVEPVESVEAEIKHNFISGQQAVEILAADDDYTSKLSIFDYNSKFQSEIILDVSGRTEVLNSHVLEWNDSQKKSVDEAMNHINDLFLEFDIDMPDINFILTSDVDEGGAAYTRGTSIILKPHSVYQHSMDLEHLIVHEMFHVYSRAHKELRSEMYAVIGYKECEELIWPTEIADLKISNPDAPDNNFYISGTYEGVEYDFMPIIFSSEPYEVGSGTSFFRTLQDKFLAVKIVDGKPEPIYLSDELLVVSKNNIAEFYDKVGLNTDYTYHPEETMADNFVFMIYKMDVKSPFVVEGLNSVIKSKN